MERQWKGSGHEGIFAAKRHATHEFSHEERCWQGGRRRKNSEQVAVAQRLRPAPSQQIEMATDALAEGRHRRVAGRRRTETG